MEARRWIAIPAPFTQAVAIKILLDSVILIDHFNGLDDATFYLKDTLGQSAVSVITRAEVLTGFATADRRQALAFLDRFHTLAIDQQIADLAADLRREHRWKLPDAFQAALASHHGLKFATRNLRDFPPHKFAFVVCPYGTGSSGFNRFS
jgi:predicted nucleic acid-binding protein